MLKSGEQSFLSVDPVEPGVQPMLLCNSEDFTEKLSSEAVSSKTDVEEFKKVLPEQDGKNV